MFKPARMSRILMGGHKDHLERLIATLHAERLLHLEDYVDPTGTTDIGTPLEHGDASSELLVHTRGLLRAIDAEGHRGKALAVDDPAALLKEADEATRSTLDEAAALRNAIADIDAERSALGPYAGLDVDLIGISGLRSVRLFIGHGDAAAALVGIEHELATDGEMFGVLVRASDGDGAERALMTAGVSLATLDGTGTPADRMAALERQRSEKAASLAGVDGRIATLRETWGSRLASLEAHLTAVVDQTQAPLQFRVTDTTFHIEGWVPEDKANRLQNALAAKFGDRLYFELLGDEPMPRTAAGHDGSGRQAHGRDGHDHGDDHGDDHDHHSEPEDEAPVHMVNRGLAKPYEFMVGLLGRPRYWEIDPTKLMFIFFPLFFGLMVGDLAVGLAIMGIGFLLKTRHIFGIGGPSVGRALIAGGFVAAIVGGFVFGEALGIHFVVDDEALEHGEHSWEEVFYGKEEVLAGTAGFPTSGFFHKEVKAHGGGHGDDATGDHDSGAAVELHDARADVAAFSLMADETEHAAPSNPLAPHGSTHLKAGPIQLGFYSKVHDIQALLLWSVIIAVVHLNLAFVLGVRNVAVSHGWTLAIQEKVSWITFQLGIGLSAWGAALDGPGWSLWGGVGIIVASLALLWKGVEKALGAPGFVAILEALGFFGNVLSYTRLAAIGASKAGMAIAFMAIGFDVVGGGTIHSVAGWIVYIIGMVVITGLAMLSGGLQALRLQFVESFQKFYTGGGRPYLPFGRRRANTP